MRLTLSEQHKGNFEELVEKGETCAEKTKV